MRPVAIPPTKMKGRTISDDFMSNAAPESPWPEVHPQAMVDPTPMRAPPTNDATRDGSGPVGEAGLAVATADPTMTDKTNTNVDKSPRDGTWRRFAALVSRTGYKAIPRTDLYD